MKEQTETLYVRIPVKLKKEIQERAEREGRTLAGMVTRMLLHRVNCEHPVRIDIEDWM